MTIFEGSAVALVLPMFDNGDIDFEGFKDGVAFVTIKNCELPELYDSSSKDCEY